MKKYKVSGFSDEIDSQVLAQFAGLNQLGMSYFEPRGIDGKNISLLTDEEVAELKQKMQVHKISVSSIGSPIGKIKLTDDFEAHFKTFQRVVEIAKELESRYIRIFSFYHDGEAWTDQERDEVFCRLRRMIAYAKEHDVVLLHENEKEIYGDNKERCLDLMRELSCEHFGAVFDPANFVQCGENAGEAYRRLKPYIRYMHIKDARATDGRVVPAGMGDGSLKEILADSIESGFDGFFSLEPHLGSFEGLEDLELSDAMLELPKGGMQTFAVAWQALNKLLEQM